jgi:predicted Zn-dependent peptidase
MTERSFAHGPGSGPRFHTAQPPRAPPASTGRSRRRNGGRRSKTRSLAPQLRVSYKAGEGNTPDYYALDVLSYLLTGGQSSRLFQKLVKEKELASSVTVRRRATAHARPRH